jgi:hypothetical protein
MSTMIALDPPLVTAVALRPLLGSLVSVHTASRRLVGTLLSCVKGTAWLVVDDTDVVVKLDDILRITPACRPTG